MKDYSNIILLRDKDDKYEKVDLVILTNEKTETIENAIDKIKDEWHENDCDYSLLEAIIDHLVDNYDITYCTSHNEIYY